MTDKRIFRPEQIIHLDLSKVDLFGWEGFPRSKERVYSLLRGIRAGDKIPLVSVWKITPKVFELGKEEDFDFLYQTEDGRRWDSTGGHHRSIAYLVAKRPMPCVLLGTKERDTKFNLVNISEIKLVSDSKVPEYMDIYRYFGPHGAKAKDPNYR